jgi:thiosulfate reductase cytochrome b subunit
MTASRTLRRGLPRERGGEPWPPADAVGAPEPAAAASADGAEVTRAVADTAAASGAPAGGAVPAADTLPASDARPRPALPALRRGLPRVHGGEPWPPADAVAPPAAVAGQAAAAAGLAPDAAVPPAATEVPAACVPAATPDTAPPSAVPAASGAAGERTLRRGLPREPGGLPWPPADARVAPTSAPAPADTASNAAAAPVDPASAPVAPATANAAPATANAAPATANAAPSALPAGTPAGLPAAPSAAAATAAPAASAVEVVAARAPLPFTPTVWPGAAASAPRAERSEPARIGPFTRTQWAGATLVGGLVLLIAAGMAVAAVRFVLSTAWGQDFLAAYPGEYHLPDGAPVGLPAWLGWQHFLNSFFLLLIIRTGLQVRREKRPSVFWSPRGNKKRKISLALWFHQALDLLWVANGVVFVVLLFVTGQWMRIVPTSWEVVPNAISAGLQYVSLDWPTENGWVNYNGLQQLAYFATTFIAAPLAIVTGVRMSGIWPKDARTLNRLYPVEWARKVHFPVMLYFVAFIVVHVALVFATGALRNLNHMYGAQDAVNWTGFWIFVASVAVMAAAWVAARPLVLAPIARLFGTVKGR